MPVQKKIAIVGSTGSVGKQTLEVVNAQRNSFQVKILSAYRNADMLVKQAMAFKPEAVIIRDETKTDLVFKALKHSNIKVYSGIEPLNNISGLCDFDLLVNGLSGVCGLKPSLNAIAQRKDIAMANKECMVAGGALIIEAAKKADVSIIPVDSEHSAVFQCLQGESHKAIRKIFLTASGGPFRGKKRDQLTRVNVEEALSHPNWNMGNKISIDSATLANKGLEAIAAQWYFDLKPDQIGIVLHPQSIVHAMVQFNDGSIKAQLGFPDMRIPIHYALNYPNRKPATINHPELPTVLNLGFEEIDVNSYPDLKLALDAMRDGGNLPSAFNAANETAVEAFLNNQVSFTKIAEISESVLKQVKMIPDPSLDEILATDAYCRELADAHIKTNLDFNR